MKQESSGRLLCVRADADSRIGVGHVMRCLAICEAWRDRGGNAVLVTATDLAFLRNRVEAFGAKIQVISEEAGSSEDAITTREIARDLGANWVVLDGYHFDASYQESLRSGDCRLFMIDDFGRSGRFYADLILNPNFHAAAEMYSDRIPFSRLLLGTRYSLLRREYRDRFGDSRETPLRARRILVTLGGSDPSNTTLHVLRGLALRPDPEREVHVVVGAANRHVDVLADEAQRLGSGYKLLFDADMPQAMAWADLAICAGGITAWELAYMGVPMLVIVLAENQKAVARSIAEQGIGRDLGWHSNILPEMIAEAVEDLAGSFDLRDSMSRQGRLLVDGQGPNRIAALLSEPWLCFREARESDCRVIWEWANEAGARASSFHSERIAWPEHVDWFARKQADPCCVIWIAANESEREIGLIRFERNDAEAIVSISVNADLRGQGYGSALLRQGCEEYFQSNAVLSIHACIKPDNYASIRIFEKTGFHFQGESVRNGKKALHYALLRSERRE